VNCHGRDGLGKNEGGVTPSNISWDALTKPYLVTHSSGRKRPPYTERLIDRAISLGLDSGGNTLHVAMPRYRLAQPDLADLIAYLKVIAKDSDPGLTDTTIRIGTTLITSGPLAESASAVKALLTAYFDEINQRGGIFNRRIELYVAESPDSTDQRVQALRECVEDARVFALTGAFMAGADEEIASLVREKEIPVVGAFTLYPQVSPPLNQYVFYTDAGVSDQGRVLAIFAADKFRAKNPCASILVGEGKGLRDTAAAMKKQCEESGWPVVEEIQSPPAPAKMLSLVQRLSQKGTEVVFLVAGAEVQDLFLRRAQEIDWKPIVLVPGSLAGNAVINPTASVAGRMFFSAPYLPSEPTPSDLAAYHTLAGAHGLRSDHLASQLMALVSAEVLIEGLKRVGRAASRWRLIEELERLSRFNTGLSRSITFRPNRRIGCFGAYIVTIDVEGRLVQASKWIELD
jgi:ABC-type branched-subunit amino acid transport system substrate-binding protein